MSVARDSLALQYCVGCDTLITPSATDGCSHQRCFECCQRLPLLCVTHLRQSGESSSVSEHGSGVVVAELEHGLLLIQVTRGDGLHYSGIIATDESTLLDVTPLPASPLLSTMLEAPVQSAASASVVEASNVVSAPAKRRYVKSGIYSKKNRAALLPTATTDVFVDLSSND